MKRFALAMLTLSLVSVGLAACGGSDSSDPAAQAAVEYINALVSKDSARLSAVSCADWELNAQLELDSFQAVETRLDGLSCASVGEQDSLTQVVCQGKIIASYNNENQELDLSVRTYQVVKQGGDYLVCGYQ